MSWRSRSMLIGTFFASFLLSGCSGYHAFTERALPGSTVMVALGHHPKLTRYNLTAEITASNGVVYQYPPGDTRVRYLINTYADPLSHLVVRDGARMDPDGGFADFVRTFVMYDENEWSEALLFMDLPTDIAPGLAQVSFTSAGVNLAPGSMGIEVLAGAPVISNDFKGWRPDGTEAGAVPMIYMERATHFVVSLAGPGGVVPHSIQLKFTRALGPTGQAWVTQGRGDLKNIMWSDNGTELIVLLTPTKGVPVSDLRDLRFYVSGAVTTLDVLDLKAYDTLGNPLSGFSAQLEQVN